MRKWTALPLFLAALMILVIGVASTATAQDAPLIIFGDMVYGHENPPEGLSCTLNNRFTHEQMVVWRMKVIDPATGLDMDDSQLETVVLTLDDGQSFDLTFGDHPPRDPTDAYWTAAWVIPADYPTGVLDFTVVATDVDGRTGELIKFPIETSTLTIVAAE